MVEKDFINVYWAPSLYTTEDVQWNFFYQEPKPVANNLLTNTTENTLAIQCPATRNILKNVYSLNSNVDDYINLSHLDLDVDALDLSDDQYDLPVDSKVSLRRVRPTSFVGYVNVVYNLGWMFFADEPLVAKFLPPYYPSATPTPGAIMSVGEFDIGQWYRPMNLDYHIPYGSSSFSVKNNEPMAFIEFKTEKKIKIHRYKYTLPLHRIAEEFATSVHRHGRTPLLKRYQIAKQAKMSELVLSEIKQNLVEN
jgi:hypothetical protein